MTKPRVDRHQVLRIAVPSAPTTVILDPDGWILAEFVGSGP